MSKCGVFSGPYFPALSANTGKYRPKKTPYLDIFHAVRLGNFDKVIRNGQFLWDLINFKEEKATELHEINTFIQKF